MTNESLLLRLTRPWRSKTTVLFAGILTFLPAALLLSPSGAASASSALLPDLRMPEPRDPRINVEPDGRHLLKFATPIWNVGQGPLVIRMEPSTATAWQDLYDAAGNLVESHIAGKIIFHPEHGHNHLDSVAVYTLRQGEPDGAVVATTPKVSICFIDIKHIPGWPDASNKSFGFAECYSDRFGISPGWMDEYPSFLPYQWVDVTGVADGIYYLVHSVNTTEGANLKEADYTNNTNWVKVKLSNGARNVQVVHE